MSRIRVLVVDDSVVARRLVCTALGLESDIEVLGSASSGASALRMIAQLKPDLVTLDVEMPEMDGLETLSKVREQDKSLPVIMFSSLTKKSAAATLEALARGASDYALKPSGMSYADSVSHVREMLAPKIKALCKKGSETESRTPPSIERAQRALARSLGQQPRVVAIGCSTGGPDALATVLGALGADFPIPILVVQHMPSTFTPFFAERLGRACTLPVSEATHGAALKGGQVWVAPGDHHLRVVAHAGTPVLTLDQDAPENACRPSVDILLRSVAQVYGAFTLGLILTGMGQDGVRGCEAVRQAGGSVWVQDDATSVVWGMPGAVANEGLADRVLPLGLIGVELNRIVRGAP